MMSFRRLSRAYEIQRVLLHYGIDEFVQGTQLGTLARILDLVQPWNRKQLKQAPRGERIRHALQELGPVFIKFGQMLSTRRDMFPDDISDELALLQDQVKPFDGKIAEADVVKYLGKPINELFESFDIEPIASASIAQVHGAKLISGEDVVVKVLRPNVERMIARDLDLLAGLAKLVHTRFSDAKRMRLPEVVEEYRKTIFDELDLRREAANAMLLKRNFEGSPDLFIPKIYWDYCHTKVMVMERIYGVPVADIKTLQEAGINMEKLAEKGVEVFFTQVFRDNFFHADMHPGNIFVDVSNPENPRYMGVDCGIMGSLTLEDQRYLAENFVAFFNRDYRKVAQLHIDSGWISADIAVADFETAIRTVCEPIFGKPLNEISFGLFLVELFQVARRFEMEVQPQLVLLEKTLLYIEGLGRQLYPQLDLWKTAKPFLENWLKDRMGVTQLMEEIKQQLPYWREKLPEIPQKFYQSIDLMPKLHSNIEQLNRQMLQQQQLNSQNNRFLVSVIIASTITICTTMIVIFADVEVLSVLSIATSALAWIQAYRKRNG
jgi:ubiquinone biosynthesis protein